MVTHRALAVHQVSCLLIAQNEFRKNAHGGLSWSEQMWRGSFRGLFARRGHVARLSDVEGADPSSPQSREVPTGTESKSHVASNRSDVCAGRTAHPHIEIDDRMPVGEHVAHIPQFALGYRDWPGRKVDLLSRAHPRIGAFTVDLDCADRARHLQDVSGEIHESCPNIIIRNARDLCGRSVTEKLTLGVVSRRRRTEANRRFVLFVETDKKGQQARR